MSNVYYKKYDGNDTSILSGIAKQMLAHMVENDGVKLMDTAPIKVHFGEKGNTTFVPATCYDGIIDYLEAQGTKTSFIETNVLYRGSRTTKDNHIALAKDHGFTRVPIIIADGDKGEAVYEVKIDKKYFESVKLGAEFENYEQIIVMSHFKGHGMAGFGGALKQLAMGFASRSGKMAQHSQLSPTVSAKKCISCGVCLESCDYDAITMDDKAEILPDKCVGCAACIAVCPVEAIRNDWGALNFREKITEYAYGAQLGKKHIYISLMINITEDCDCIGHAMDPVARNYGVLASTDPVSLDAACLDILQAEHKNMFEAGRTSLIHAKEIGFSDVTYTLVEL